MSPGISPIFKGGKDSTDFLTDNPGKEPSYFEIPVPAGKRHLNVILPEDTKRGLGPSQIATVSVPWSVFVQTSLFKNPTSLYVTTRC